MKLDQTLKLVNDWIRKTGEIQQATKEGQKCQADQFLQSTAKKQKLTDINIGDNVVFFFVPLALNNINLFLVDSCAEY